MTDPAAPSPETDVLANLEWQVANGSRTAHVFTAPVVYAKRGERGWRSGPAALCKRYPLRNGDGVWFSFPVGEAANRALAAYAAHRCKDCKYAIADLVSRPGQPPAEGAGRG